MLIYETSLSSSDIINGQLNLNFICFKWPLKWKITLEIETSTQKAENCRIGVFSPLSCLEFNGLARNSIFMLPHTWWEMPTCTVGGMSNQSTWWHTMGNLIHVCICYLLDLITPHDETGLSMMSSDRVWWRYYPIFAIFIGNYPKQTLVTCTYNSWCPKYVVSPNELGKSQTFLSICNHLPCWFIVC